MKHFKLKILFLTLFMVAVAPGAGALSLALDSIAQWGKFPKFCIDVYRWGDKFFNSYDSTYVVGTGYKFNAKVTTDSWFDFYQFRIRNDNADANANANALIDMRTDPSTSIGLYVQYLALSVGYDINFSKLFGGPDRSRSRFNFGFNCSLLSAEVYFIKNDVGTRIRRLNDTKVDIDFNGVYTDSWGVDCYYFFNHKRYSQSAAFSYGKIQRRSQGSLYTGFSISGQKYDFDFSQLPDYVLENVPDDWPNYHYRVRTHNYAVRVGYGYNWVFAPKWVLGVSESPIIGFRKGLINSQVDKWSFSLLNRFSLSVVWNHHTWFAGIVGKIDSGLVNEKQTTMISSVISVQAAVGYRFNIW